MKKISKERLKQAISTNIKTFMIIVVVSVVSSLFTLGIVAVSAHGGDTNKVHSCVRNNILNASNVRIVGENDNQYSTFAVTKQHQTHYTLLRR